ncbi:MAG: hypothetical protein RSD45_06735 [Gordonibacter sp.]
MNRHLANDALSLEPDFDAFDPLEESEEPTEEGGADEFVATVRPAEDALAGAGLEIETVIDNRPAEERIRELFTAMAPRRTVLLGILSFCTEAQPVDAVAARIDTLQENNYSVYSPANLCALLESAGALDRVTPDGERAQPITFKPSVVVVDGIEYLEAHEPLTTCWLATKDGRAYLEADKPLDRLLDLLSSETTYAAIYERVLKLASQENGATTAEFGEAVDNDPLVQKPRYYAMHFVDQLEKCDALAWKSAWHLTEIGKAGLEALADMADKTTTPANEKE